MRPALILFFLVLTACGSGGGGSGGAAAPCANHAWPSGTYTQNAGTATLTFRRDCTGTESVDCGLVYTYLRLASTDTLASLRLNVTASNGGGACLSIGTHYCSWSTQPSQLNLDCGFGNVNYSWTAGD
jgi:hypothetical protein